MNLLLTKVQEAALDMAMNYVLKDPAHKFSRLLDVVETLDITNEHAGQLEIVRPMAADPETPGVNIMFFQKLTKNMKIMLAIWFGMWYPIMAIKGGPLSRNGAMCTCFHSKLLRTPIKQEEIFHGSH